MVTSAVGVGVLPIRIPVDRCYDTQWNFPGHPSLNVFSLQPPYNDSGSENRDGYYTFEVKENGEISSFIRITKEASHVVRVFQTVEFLVVSDDILFFRGNGYYCTLIKGSNIEANDSPGIWATQAVEESDIKPKEWLLMNFPEPTSAPITSEPTTRPTSAPTTSEPTSATIASHKNEPTSATIASHKNEPTSTTIASHKNEFYWRMLVWALPLSVVGIVVILNKLCTKRKDIDKEQYSVIP